MSKTPPNTRLILAIDDLLQLWGSRTENGDLVTAEWGEPKPEGWYEPIFFAHHDDNLIAKERARIRAAVERHAGKEGYLNDIVSRAAVLAIIDGEA